MFESGVIPDGVQAWQCGACGTYLFESGVIPDGVQAHIPILSLPTRLRVV